MEKEGISPEEIEKRCIGSLRLAVKEGDVNNGSFMEGQIALVFPGQDSQYVAMAKDLCENKKKSKNIIDYALSELNIDLKDIMFSGIDKLTRFDASNFQTQVVAEVKYFNGEKYINKKELKRMDRFSQYAVVVSKMAVEDAKLDLDGIDRNKRVTPFFIPMMISNMAAGQVSIYLGAKGPNTNVCTACASGTHSIGDAFKIIQRGDADIMVAGGSEAPITALSFSGFCNMKAMSTRNDGPKTSSRPFDKDRDGFVMGEGAGIVILESLEHALKRNAKIYAEVVGYGLTADAYHMTTPAEDGGGAIRAMIMALEDGNVPLDEVDYINTHGTSTPYNDRLETLSIKNVFKDKAYNLCVSSIKSMTRHLLGAASAVEAVVCAVRFMN